MNPTVII